MRSVNKVILIGNIVRDPESKKTTSWHSFTSFTLATNREWHNTWWAWTQSLAEFHKVVTWWKLADLCSRYLKKWKFVYIEWYLKTRVWEVEWKKLYRTEIVAQDMIMLNKRQDWDELDTYQREDKGLNDEVFPDEEYEQLAKKWEINLDGDDI